MTRDQPLTDQLSNDDESTTCLKARSIPSRLKSACLRCIGARDSFIPVEPKPGEFVEDPSAPPPSIADDPALAPEPPNGDPEHSDDASENVLRIVRTNLRLADNGQAHRTDKFDLMMRISKPQLVIRRGQDFFIDITFNRTFKKETDGVSFLFTVADGKPVLGNGTLVTVPLVSKRNAFEEGPHEWHAFIHEINAKKITVQIKTSSNCSVGRWRIAIDTKLKQSRSASSYSLPNPIYVLYNPWNPDDEVYLDDENARNEYVLEDAGLIWRGSHNLLRPSSWTFGQFEPDVLDSCIYIMRKSIEPRLRGDVVHATRVLSALVNSNDDNGVVVGNWSDDFSGGTSPSKWTGSAKILQSYYQKKSPVKFGQCWVFAGVLTTVCRAIGIPARPVSNFSSAHDTEGSLTIDYFVDEEGKPVKHLNRDSIWNFHVWTEVWMKREDMGDERYWGWQAIDATPQELSGTIYRMGPASVEACRRGEIKRNYDTAFLFSEVNADKVYWRYYGESEPLKLLTVKPNTDSIGLHISTKAIGSFDREDITLSYKHPEKSDEEREVMVKALKQSGNLFSRYYLNAEFNDVRFDFDLLDDIVIGSPFRVRVIMRNVSLKSYPVRGILRVDSVLYTGRVQQTVMKKNFNIDLASKAEQEVLLEVTYKDYAKSLTNQATFRAACLAKFDETDFEYFAEDDFRVRKPDIKFAFQTETGVVDQPLHAKAYFKNPLPTSLTRGRFIIDAPGFGDPIKVSLTKDVKPGDLASATFTLTPKVSGERTITAKFNSRELEDVDGFVYIAVQPQGTEIISNEI